MKPSHWPRLLAALALLAGPADAFAAMTFSNARVSGVTQTGVSALQTDVWSDSSNAYTATFDFGPTAAYGQSNVGATGDWNVQPNFNGTISSVAVTGLTCGTTYHYRINVAAAASDVDHTFTTSACGPTVPTLSEWGLIILTGSFALFLAVRARRVRRESAR